MLVQARRASAAAASLQVTLRAVREKVNAMLGVSVRFIDLFAMRAPDERVPPGSCRNQ
jgi:hypothetical protein